MSFSVFFDTLDNKVPEWIKEYLPFLPNMIGNDETKNQITEIEKYAACIDEEDCKELELNEHLWTILQAKISLLRDLHGEGKLK
jgi:hypothetical protein